MTLNALKNLFVLLL